MKKLLLLAFTITILFDFSYGSDIVYDKQYSESGEVLMQPQVKIEGAVNPEQGKYFNPVVPISMKKEILQSTGDVLDSIKGTEFLFPMEYSAFMVDTRSKKVDFIPPNYTIAPECYDALKIAPNWLYGDLKLKFRRLKIAGMDDDYAKLILAARDISEKIVDEVAFLVAHISVESLINSRFKSDMNYLLRIPQFIYNVDDSLKYVDIVEHGDFATGDYYTTTKYKIKDGTNGNIIWSEIPKEYYYWYIVHPKLYQEGVYVQDNEADQQQRTYGYSFQDYIWSNPLPNYDYTNVNLTSQYGTVTTIPRFGELMQKPDVLWDRNKTYFLFGRQFNDGDHALNALGNWASQAVPADPIIGLPRAIHPNQILYLHRGRCGEDTYLVTAACRTALIPAIYRGTAREDHVFDAVWDMDWNHFEFFRGGLAYSGWGWTNLYEGGNYETLAPDYWVLSIVHGFRPDGYIFNHTSYYTPTCFLKLRIADKNGNPMDGVQVQFFAAPGHNSDANDQGIMYSGETFTDHSGEIYFKAGDRKYYYLRFYHPSFGVLPSETQVYNYVNQFTNQGQIYDGGTINIQTATMPDLSVTELLAPKTGNFGVNINWSAKEIITGVNDRDSQRSRFYKCGDESSGSVAFFICDSANYEKFRAGTQYEAYLVRKHTKEGNVSLALPGEGKWYAVFTNKLSLSNYQEVNASCSLIEGPVTEVEENPENIREIVLKISPNPFNYFCRIEAPAGTEYIEIYDVYGRLISTLTFPFDWQPEQSIAEGVYLIRAKVGGEVISGKVVYVR